MQLKKNEGTRKWKERVEKKEKKEGRKGRLGFHEP
jgi:hypothetical protein